MVTSCQRHPTGLVHPTHLYTTQRDQAKRKSSANGLVEWRTYAIATMCPPTGAKGPRALLRPFLPDGITPPPSTGPEMHARCGRNSLRRPHFQSGFSDADSGIVGGAASPHAC